MVVNFSSVAMTILSALTIFFNVTLSDTTYYWQVTADCATIGNVNLLSSVTDEMIIDSGSTCVCKF